MTPDEMEALIAEARDAAERQEWVDYSDTLLTRLADALEASYDAGRRELAERFASQDATRRAAIEELAAWEEQG